MRQEKRRRKEEKKREKEAKTCTKALNSCYYSLTSIAFVHVTHSNEPGNPCVEATA